MAIGQARLKPLTLSALATRERSMGERREWRRTNYFVRKIVWFGDILK